MLHPRRVLKGVVAGVRDYGNRMGIPTVNGALAVDPGYLANPLVFCGTVGVLPRGMATKHVEAGDRIVAIGGRTGRDGIHGATFSSAELTGDSESVSGGAVQIGNAITEKMVLDVIAPGPRPRPLPRDHRLRRRRASARPSARWAQTSAPRSSSSRAPLKYAGLSYTEIWISEAQERMVLAVPAEKWPELRGALRAARASRPPTSAASSTPGRLTLRYRGELVADLSMDFLHDGRPTVVREASWSAPPERPIAAARRADDFTDDLLAILQHWDVCSKEWIVRQYDHEVQGGTVIKPLVGVRDDGPGDASVVLPVRGLDRAASRSAAASTPATASSTPMRWPAASSTRRCATAWPSAPTRRGSRSSTTSAGATPSGPRRWARWSVRPQACRDVALAYATPFISGKDSLNNEYTHEGRAWPSRRPC